MTTLHSNLHSGRADSGQKRSASTHEIGGDSINGINIPVIMSPPSFSGGETTLLSASISLLKDST
jgi:hypothetical protein